jgi:hypothetical protein
MSGRAFKSLHASAKAANPVLEEQDTGHPAGQAPLRLHYIGGIGPINIQVCLQERSNCCRARAIKMMGGLRARRDDQAQWIR